MILFSRRPKPIAIFLLIFIVSAGVTSISGFQKSRPAMRRLEGHVPIRAFRNANWLGREMPDASISMSIALPLRNRSELESLLARLYDPADPLYGKYLTTEEFIDRFCPTPEDYDEVKAYAQKQGLSITAVHSNGLLLEVEGSARTVENSFHLQMHRFMAQDGRDFHAPDSDPEVPDAVASRIAGVIGLDNAAVLHPRRQSRLIDPQAEPMNIGTGPGGGMSPSDISTAYNLNSFQNKGSGQVLGLFEIDGYNTSDIAAYESKFSLSAVPLKNVLVSGATGNAGSNALEVTLDIELMIAMAPKASQIIVYEGPNTSSGILSTYNKIATENAAKQVSTSWGIDEGNASNSFLTQENTIFTQMAAQGQTIFASAGDKGAYNNGSALSVDDPASQPYVVGVGGTQLSVNSGETYNKEKTWNNNGSAGGGGISAQWEIPSYQQGVGTAASSTMRNVPDVALNADPSSGYAIYYNGQWYVYGGTSCAAPLWAGFLAIVNQNRVAGGSSTLGFANPAFYQIGKGANYSSGFHDIADGSSNNYYTAVAGYDNATGWGSFNGANLIAILTNTQPVQVPSAPQNLSATAGNAKVTLNWTASTSATQYLVYRRTSSYGSFSQIATTSGASYVNSNLTNNTTYYYYVKASNSAGTSAASSTVYAKPTVSFAITSGPSVSAGRTSATISWVTNFASNSFVYYGTDSGNLNKTASNSSSVTTHTFSFSSLSPGATYYYTVSSSTSSSTVTSDVFNFATTKEIKRRPVTTPKSNLIKRALK
jgi:kumamolisin